LDRVLGKDKNPVPVWLRSESPQKIQDVEKKQEEEKKTAEAPNDAESSDSEQEGEGAPKEQLQKEDEDSDNEGEDKKKTSYDSDDDVLKFGFEKDDEVLKFGFDEDNQTATLDKKNERSKTPGQPNPKKRKLKIQDTEFDSQTKLTSFFSSSKASSASAQINSFTSPATKRVMAPVPSSSQTPSSSKSPSASTGGSTSSKFLERNASLIRVNSSNSSSKVSSPLAKTAPKKPARKPVTYCVAVWEDKEVSDLDSIFAEEDPTVTKKPKLAEEASGVQFFTNFVGSL
jgi:hypothetical protein